MHFAGIDIGSRTIEVVVVDDQGTVISSLQTDTGFDPMASAEKLLRDIRYHHIMATGYGRNLFEIAYDAATVTEIKAHAVGVRSYFPEARTILDIGGQDSKAIALTENGKVRKFEMNDRCAAGTGKFLEIMARSLGYNIHDFGQEALLADKELNISSMCTVFAESEVTTLIAKGEDRRAIAKGLHLSVIRRAASMINRVSADGDIVFSGGVANNPCMIKLLAERLNRGVVRSDNPHFMGALGAALLAARGAGNRGG